MKDKNDKYALGLESDLVELGTELRKAKSIHCFLGLVALFASDRVKDKVKLRKDVISMTSNLGTAKDELLRVMPACVQARIVAALKLK